ncbi:hypothetical protein BGW42_002068 [Actinomortierella wolfii]|nr:hypothetical protein BGW42_002068 [Actinomortierella wolfii]
MTTITVLGLGNMGEALALAFLKAGYKVTVWNRSPEKATKVIANGARLANSVIEALEASELIVICLLDNNAVTATLQKALPSLRDRTVVNVTNGTQEHAHSTGATVLAQGAKYIHGAILSIPAIVGTPESFSIYSGDKDVYESVQEYLRALGTPRHLATDIGAASLYDLALLSSMYGLFSGFTHAVSLVKAYKDKTDHNATVDDFVQTLLIPLLKQMVQYCTNKGKNIDDKQYIAPGSTNAMQIPALENIVEASKAVGVSPDLLLPIQRLFQVAVASGYADANFTSFVEFTIEKDKE